MTLTFDLFVVRRVSCGVWNIRIKFEVSSTTCGSSINSRFVEKQCSKVKTWPPSCLRKLGGDKLKIRLGNRDNRIQHVQIVLKSQVPGLHPKMPL